MHCPWWDDAFDDATKRQTAGIKFTHRPKIRFFAPQGRLVAPIHVKLGWADGHVGPLLGLFRSTLSGNWKIRLQSPSLSAVFISVGRTTCTAISISFQFAFSLTYKALTTAEPTYLHSLISVQPTRATRSSSVVTLSRPSTSSSLRITNRPFRYASPHLWSQLAVSFRQPCTKHPADDVTLSNSPPTCSPLSPSITHSLFHSRLKTHLFHKSFPQ